MFSFLQEVRYFDVLTVPKQAPLTGSPSFTPTPARPLQKKLLIADELAKKRGKFQKRYFALYDDLLAWFKEKNDPKPLGLVPTECFSHVTLDAAAVAAGVAGAGGADGAGSAATGAAGAGAGTNAAGGGSGSSDGTVTIAGADATFTLVFSGPEAEHSLCLSASSAEEARKWIRALQSVIEAPAMRARKQKDYKLQAGFFGVGVGVGRVRVSVHFFFFSIFFSSCALHMLHATQL